MNERTVKISVIIPAREAENILPICLQAIGNSSDLPHEVIVVDDCSTDLTAAIGRSNGAKVLKTERHSGPAAARNIGARNASGDILLFIDSDVVIRADTVKRVGSHFQADNCAAAFGSYDDEPAEQNFISQYKNLQHHFVHQTANRDAATFWAGCGAIRREVFLEVGGFDEIRYPRPSIEDIELGHRVRAQGYRVVLDKEMCVKHLKKWTFRSHIRTEIINRAIPWSKMIFDSGKMIHDLNLTVSHRVSAALVYVLILCIPLLAFDYWFLLPMFLSFIGILLLNLPLYRFFWKHRGLGFALKSLPMHLLHYTYSAAAFVLCWTNCSLRRVRSRVALIP